MSFQFWFTIFKFNLRILFLIDWGSLNFLQDQKGSANVKVWETLF
jgi:hypothetical protein